MNCGLSRVSTQWINLLLGSPNLWSTWNINSRDYYWDYSAILKLLPSMDPHISELTLSYSTDLKYFTEKLFDRISNGHLNRLETLKLYSKFMI